LYVGRESNIYLKHYIYQISLTNYEIQAFSHLIFCILYRLRPRAQSLSFWTDFAEGKLNIALRQNKQVQIERIEQKYTQTYPALKGLYCDLLWWIYISNKLAVVQYKPQVIIYFNLYYVILISF
jgi:hypothetical protein